MGKGDPKARDRIIGAKLRAIRTEQVKISLERGAELAGWSLSRLSRTERGLRNVTTDEVATLLTAWRIPVKDREEFLGELQADSSSGWWDRLMPRIPASVGALASYEADANEVVSVNLGAVPGMLQTYGTALGIMRSAGVSDADAEIRWMVRLRRQQILGKIEYTAFIDEQALATPFGGVKAQREQLKHLLDAQDRGIRVRIIPSRQTQLPLLHSWHWMGFPNMSPVIHVELQAGAFYIHGPDVAPYAEAQKRLEKIALSQAESRKVISGLAKGL